MGNCCQPPEAVSKEIKQVRLSGILHNTNAENKSKEETTINSTGPLVIALHSLQSENNAILNFNKGDKLVLENDSDPDWCLVRHVNSETRGFAPRTYLVFDTIVGNEDWFFGDTVREDAERMLLQPENMAGTFLIRNSHISGTYALSLKDYVPQTNEVLVRHYKIRTLDNGGYFISPSRIFSTLKELVAHYSEASDGICRTLFKVCPRTRPTITGPLPDSRDEYEVPFESLQFIQLLGKGNFGEVFHGIWNGTCDVAIKCLTSSGVLSDEFRREVAVMKAITHPKIVRLYAICTEREPFCIIMEYLCKGNLQLYLKTPHGKQLRLPSLVHMAAQIADGMKYLESSNLIHRDLAARNILVGDGDVVKLADFGLARIMDDAIYVTKGGKLPIKWTAPEALMSCHCTIKSDIWSYGIVLYEIFTHGEMPYQGMKNQQVIDLITKHNYRLPRPTDPECSDPVYEIMMLCWKEKPEERPTFEYLYHYFTDYYISSETSYREAERIN
ncbi:hypothetical protein JTE90_025974 [Oedothorax gibbosus]|uniref:Tyrosine-protein kinase n=1 Tax=Oedothorax gibbosus TaxID=931172 RepID=A0AAV6U6Y0_9ARAC|nr:hypothetical protein JTE90_025974 [Oedothorax gibbosus]